MKTACCYVPSPSHVYGGHPESPERFSFLDLAPYAGNSEERFWLEAEPAPDDAILRVHTPAVLEMLRQAERQAPAVIDAAPTYISRGSVEAALRAAGAALTVTGAVLDGQAKAGAALVRPPGHHAEAWRPMGFCLLNNLAVAVQYALDQGIERVLIVDFDAHHGNGTENIFEDNPRVAYISTHQYGIYPGTGGLTPSAEGRGRMVNIPLPVFAGDKALMSAIEQAAVPLAEQFKPAFLFVSAGFDAHWQDPLTALGVSTPGFYEICGKLLEMAAVFCGGRIVFVLEGGYHPLHLAENIAGMLDALAGRPLSQDSAGACPYPAADIQPILDRVRAVHGLT